MTETKKGSDTEIAAAAERLIAAETTRIPCSPVRDLIGHDDVASAYAVQEIVTAHRIAAGGIVIGRKIGLTSGAVQAQMGVDQPDFGVLFGDMAYSDGDPVPHASVLQPRVEAEIAFILGRDLEEGALDDDQVRQAVDGVLAAIEICGSRVEGWDISFSDTVADNASAGAFVLGADRRTLDEVEPRDVSMVMTLDGEVVSTGRGADCLGDPLNAVGRLARQARDLGDPLRAGQIVLSGALGAMRPVAAPGVRAAATISGLGTVSVNFTA